MRDDDFTIVLSEKLAQDVYRLVIRARSVARSREPRQNFILGVDEQGERIPLAIADADADTGNITVIFQVAGAATAWLASLTEGDSIPNLQVDQRRTPGSGRVPMVIAAVVGALVLAGGLAAFLMVQRAGPTDSPVVETAAARAAPAPAEPGLQEAPLPAHSRKASKAAPAMAPAPPSSALPPGVKPGYLTIATIPPVQVHVDGELVSMSPLIKYPLAPGPHTVRLYDKESWLNQSFRVQINKGKITQEHMRFKHGVVEFNALANTEIWLGKRKLGTTPLKPLKLYNGTYTFRAVDSQLGKERLVQYRVQAGQKNKIKIDMTQP